MQVDVMNARKAKLGSDHPDTLMNMANLALTYWTQGRLDEAHSLLSSAAHTMQQVIGTHHPTVLHYIEQLNKLLKAKQHKESQEAVSFVCMHICF